MKYSGVLVFFLCGVKGNIIEGLSDATGSALDVGSARVLASRLTLKVNTI